MNLSREEYGQWAKRFCALCGWHWESEAAMLAEWYHVLGLYTTAELEYTMSEIAKSKTVPKVKAEYRAWIHRLVDQFRASQYRAKSEQAESNERGICTLCGSSGMVEVPHPKCVQDGQWIPRAINTPFPGYYTASVFCHCSLGRYKHNRSCGKDDKPAGITVQAYTDWNPHWKEQFRKRRNEVQAEARQTGSAKRTRETLGAMMARLGMREPGVDDEG